MNWLTWLPRLLWLGLWFAWAQFTASVHVLRDAFRPRITLDPGFIHYETVCRSDFEVTLLSMLITLTPGTLTIGAEQNEDGGWSIVVHGMYCPERSQLVDDVRDMEVHMLSAIRREGFAR